MQVTGSRLIYENRWLRLREDRIVLPDGSPGIYSVVEKAPAALIVPRAADGRLWLVQQHRHPTGERSWEFAQGAFDTAPQTPPEELARGELAEETGLRAERWTWLGRMFFAPGICNQEVQAWLAEDLTQGEQALEPTEEGLVVGCHTRAEIDALILEGALTDAATIAALGLLDLRGL
jgi:8-oxo-dGTP pyrophosphatase MutT (NUDIX family)